MCVQVVEGGQQWEVEFVQGADGAGHEEEDGRVRARGMPQRGGRVGFAGEVAAARWMRMRLRRRRGRGSGREDGFGVVERGSICVFMLFDGGACRLLGAV